MRPLDYDVMIVGARVLLVDKDALRSDDVLSTSSISPPGIDVLDEAGIGEDLRAVTPPVRTIRLNAEGLIIEAQLRDGRAGYCPRRERLDGLLQQAAVDAGVELRDQTRVTSLVRERDRVNGGRAVSGGRERTFTAGFGRGR